MCLAMDFLRVALALITVFGLLGLLYFISNRAKAKGPLCLARPRSIWRPRFGNAVNGSEPDSLRVLRRVNLTSTHQVHLLRASEETLLLCTHPQGCTLLRAGDASSAAKQESAASEGLRRYAS